MFIRSARQAKELSRKNKEIQLQQKALTIANQGLQASEEESKQNAEELLSVNEKLTEEKQLTEEALRELKAAKNELVQSEKMASIGQLTAGIAHEINNPVNYISGGAQALRDIIRDIDQILTTYVALSHATSQEEVDDAKQKIKEKLEEIGEGPEELIEEVNLMFGDIMTGVERVTEITGGLRTFARGDTDKKQEADVHELIDSSLVILRNKYKHRIEIHKMYEADYSNIECFPGPLSQVFMNLIGNSVDAIKEKGNITIQTRNLSDKLIVSIADDGMGIPEKVRSNIFNPFFTTKGVGKGTGLGLSIVHGIIEKHGGKIEVVSEEGKGAEFIIELPSEKV